MRTGPPPEPINEKRRRGARIRKAVVVVPMEPALVVLPSEPTPGDVLVQSILGGPAARWVMQSDQLVILALLRDGWNERDMLRRAIASVPPEEWAMRPQSPAALTRLGVVERQLTEWAAQLGLSPVERSRLGVAEATAKSRLASLREQRDQARAEPEPRARSSR